MWKQVLHRQLVLNRTFGCIHSAKINAHMLSMSGNTGASGNNQSQSQSTVDKEDVQRHAKQMKEWWDPAGTMKALHAFNLIRAQKKEPYIKPMRQVNVTGVYKLIFCFFSVPFVRDGLADCIPEKRTLYPLQGKSILDVGCGGGLLSEPLARLGAKVTGVDASQELIELAKEHSSVDPKMADNKPTYICTSVEEHAENHENVYDGVVASEIIEHVNNPELFVKSCARVLKPGGRIFITTPNRSKLTEFTVICLAENVFGSIPKGTHQIEKFLTPPEISLMLERNDCHVEAVQGIFYNVVTNTWSWSQFVQLMFAVQAIKGV